MTGGGASRLIVGKGAVQNTWMVWDRKTRSPAKVQGGLATRLSRERAPSLGTTHAPLRRPNRAGLRPAAAWSSVARHGKLPPHCLTKNVTGQLPCRIWGGSAESVRWRLWQGRSACAQSARSHQRWPSVIERAVGSRRDGSLTSFAPSRDGIASTRSGHCQWTGHRYRPCRGGGAGPTGLPFAMP